MRRLSEQEKGLLRKRFISKLGRRPRVKEDQDVFKPASGTELKKRGFVPTRYMTDDEIARTYEGFKITELQFNPSRKSGFVEIDFPNRESVFDNFVIYESGKIAFENWYPDNVYLALVSKIEAEQGKTAPKVNMESLTFRVHNAPVPEVVAKKVYGLTETEISDALREIQMDEGCKGMSKKEKKWKAIQKAIAKKKRKKVKEDIDHVIAGGAGGVVEKDKKKDVFKAATAKEIEGRKKGQPYRRYYFPITISGVGYEITEAWDDAVDNFSSDPGGPDSVDGITAVELDPNSFDEIGDEKPIKEYITPRYVQVKYRHERQKAKLAELEKELTKDSENQALKDEIAKLQDALKEGKLPKNPAGEIDQTYIKDLLEQHGLLQPEAPKHPSAVCPDISQEEWNKLDLKVKQRIPFDEADVEVIAKLLNHKMEVEELEKIWNLVKEGKVPNLQGLLDQKYIKDLTEKKFIRRKIGERHG